MPGTKSTTCTVVINILLEESLGTCNCCHYEQGLTAKQSSVVTSCGSTLGVALWVEPMQPEDCNHGIVNRCSKHWDLIPQDAFGWNQTQLSYNTLLAIMATFARVNTLTEMTYIQVFTKS